MPPGKVFSGSTGRSAPGITSLKYDGWLGISPVPSGRCVGGFAMRYEPAGYDAAKGMFSLVTESAH